MIHENLLKELKKTISSFQSIYSTTLKDAENKIKDIPSDEAKRYNEIIAKIKKATRENDLNTLRNLSQEIKNTLNL